MPVIEMRESLGQMDVIVPKDNKNNENVAVIQKRINLKEGTWQRNMLQMDLFFDDMPHVLQPGELLPQPFSGVIEFYLTPTPIILTKQTVQLCKLAGPIAANNNVLFKGVINQVSSSPLISGTAEIEKFPQNFLATNANFPFFHDQLYLTMVFHGTQRQDNDLVVRFTASMYMSYNEKKVSAIRSTLGVISERFEMMIPLIQKQGRKLLNVNNLQGDTIPAYNWGGIRPELMVSGQTLSQYFLRRDGQEAELTQTPNSLRSFAKLARQMVPNPTAFGTANTIQGNIPDWFAEMLPKGVEAGPVRPQFPPRVTQDDPALPGLGNILCV